MELIQFETQLITENKIEITNDCTVFAKKERVNYPNLKELEKEVKALRKELKEKNVSLGKTNTLQTLKNSVELYQKTVKDYNDTFNQYLVAWSNKLHIGLYTGYSNDQYYTEVIRPLKFKLDKFNQRDNILSVIREIEYDVNDIKKDLKIGRKFTKIYL